MSDRYLNLVNSPIGAKVASTVGLPRPAVLRRFRAGDPIVPGPVLLGSTSGKVPAALTEIVAAAGAEAVTEPGEGAKWGALLARCALGRDPVRSRQPARLSRRRGCAHCSRPDV